MNSPHSRLVRSATALVLASLVLSACGGGGGGGGSTPPPVSVTISGRITFDRIGFDATLGNGLNPTAPVESPARQVTVQAIDAGNSSVLATATTDTNGNYSVSVPSGRNLFIRARAEMVKSDATPTWNFSVRNNTTAGTNDALYALDGSPASSGTADSTRNLRAATGFGTTSYTGTRAAAPFAILDTAYRAKELVLSAAPSTEFPELRMFWSDQNRPTANRFCPDTGDIGTTSYQVFGTNDRDSCNQTNSDGIYILGDFANGAGDTDEFDQSVIAHEFGHYVEDKFGRSDSIGGQHGNDLPLDLRVAFGEGWGDAFSGMVLGNSVYRDSQQGVTDDFSFDLEADADASDGATEGWFSEFSVGEILWDLFDPANEPGDTVALGFTPIFTAITSQMLKDTDALTSIFTFADALRAGTPSAAAGLDDLLAGENIHGTDDFGAGESNAGGATGILPIYKTIMLNQPISVCSRSPFGDDTTNKLGNRVFIRFDNDTSRAVAIQVDGAPAPMDPTTTFATDPDVFVLRRGGLVQFGASTPAGNAPHSTPGHETISQFVLAAGTVIIEVYDFEMSLVTNPQPRCMTVQITGN
jgi:hypothetical protein